MISTLSKFTKINDNANKMPTRFNSSLPINIEVLNSMSMNRYKLLIGRKEHTTKSQKNLKVGSKYWGSFGETKDNVIAISNLYLKPSFLQDEENFLNIECTEFLKQFEEQEKPLETFKIWILNNLADIDINKKRFQIHTNMLLALKKNIIHLPLVHNGKITLLQFSYNHSDPDFYCTFENLGPIKGRIYKNILDLEVLFEKTYYFLTKEIEKFDIVANISINKQINPLYETDELILDLKG